MSRFFLPGFVVVIALMIFTGCGETYRPIIIPNPPTFPNPAAAHTVLTISDNGDFVAGSAMVIDVTGDADVSEANANIHPVHAVQQTANEVLVVNQAATLSPPLPTTSCLVAVPPQPPNQVFNVCSSITKLNFSGTTIGSTTAITLPIYSGANFVAVAPTDTVAYVTLPTYPPDPTKPQTIVPSVGVVNTNSNLMESTASVGSNPVALAVTPDKKKLYVANDSLPCQNPLTPGVCSISSFNVVTSGGTVNLTPRLGSPVSTSSPPVWLVPRTDNQRVYVLEANGRLAWLDTTSTPGPDPLTETAIVVPGATTMIYDSNKNRLYIPGGQEVAIVDVSQSAPVIMTGAPIAIPTVGPGSRAATDPCSVTTAQQLTVAAAAALPDASRAYVGAYYEDAVNGVNYVCPQVTVIDVASNDITTSIAVPGFPAYDAFCSTTRFRITMAAGGSSTRAYLASCDGGNINMIDTSNNTYIETLPAPVGTRQTVPPGPLNLPQNPVFLIAGP